MHDVREGELAVPVNTLPSIEEEGNVERLGSFGRPQIQLLDCYG